MLTKKLRCSLVVARSLAAAVFGALWGPAVAYAVRYAAAVGVLAALAALAVAAPAQGALYGAQPATGNIVAVDPATGAVTDSFDAPGDLQSGHTRVGLSGAEGGTTLIYVNDEGTAASPLFRLHPTTGAVLSTQVADDTTNDGLSFQTAPDLTKLIFSSHSDTDIHRQTGFSGPDDSQWATGAPIGGLGGDGFGREFGFFDDGRLHEYDPFSDTDAFISTLPAPSGIQGLAFDGTFLYASTASGNLYTLNANTGAILRAVPVSGGALYGLGVALEAPPPPPPPPPPAEGGVLYGAQPATGNIVTVDPATGAVTDSFDAPGDLQSGHTRVGLSGSEEGTTLIYVNDEGTAASPLFRLDPATGTVLSKEVADDTTNDGLSFQTAPDFTALIFSSHSDTDIHRQEQFSGPDDSNWVTGDPVGGLGGDDFGREFGFFDDGSLHEYDPFSDTDAFISTLPAPALDIQGLAFDGINLYASTPSGTLYTLNPDTGVVLNTVTVAGGALYGLGVAQAPVSPPVGVADAYSVVGGGTLTVPAPGVLGNDTDPDGDPLTAQLVSTTTQGTLTLNPNGSFTYVAPDGAAGTDSFTYVANDGTSDSNIATVTITIQAGCAGRRPTQTGGPGNDELSGSGGNDVILGLGGNDTIEPGSGNDVVCAGSGNDNVRAGSGNDIVRGGSGNDTLDGGSGNDMLFGEAGIDRLFGGGDNDALDGGADSPDRCDGEGGSDTATAGCEVTVSL